MNEYISLGCALTALRLGAKIEITYPKQPRAGYIVYANQRKLGYVNLDTLARLVDVVAHKSLGPIMLPLSILRCVYSKRACSCMRCNGIRVRLELREVSEPNSKEDGTVWLSAYQIIYGDSFI